MTVIRKTISRLSMAASAALMLGLAAQAQQQGPPPALVEVKEATTELMAPEVFIPGTVVSMNDSRIAAEISGRVTWVAPEGTRVAEGDVIAEIDDRNLELLVARGEAAVTRLEARIRFLRADQARLRELVADSYSPTSRLEQAESDLAMAEQDLSDARAVLKQSKIDLDRTKVRAPFPGRVVQRLAQIGEYATPGREIARLVDTENVEVSAQAPVSLAGLVVDGQPVSFRFGTALTPTSLRAIVPVGDQVSRTMELRVVMPASAVQVVGAAVEIGLPSAAPTEVVAVPRDALVLRTNGTYVYRLKDDMTAERLMVRTGTASGNLVAVSGGVSGGDRVVVRGGERLRPGQSVQIRETAEKSVAQGR